MDQKGPSHSLQSGAHAVPLCPCGAKEGFAEGGDGAAAVARGAQAVAVCTQRFEGTRHFLRVDTLCVNVTSVHFFFFSKWNASSSTMHVRFDAYCVLLLVY